MKNVSEKYLEKMQDGLRTFIPRMSVDGVELDGDIQAGLTINTGSCGAERFMIGNAFIPYITATISECSMRLQDREILLEMGLVLADGSIEYKKMGYFTVEKPEKDKFQTSFTAYGRLMSKAGGIFENTLEYPASVQSVLDEVSRQTGLTIRLNGVAAEGQILTPFIGELQREVLMRIAGLLGGFVTEDGDGNIVISKYALNRSVTIDTDFCYIYPETNDIEYTVTGVEVLIREDGTDEEGNVIPGEKYSSESVVNVFLQNLYMTETLFKTCESNVVGFSYMPAKVEFLGDISLEPWDSIVLTDEDPDAGIDIPCMSIVHTWDGGIVTTVTAPGSTATEDNSSFGGPLSTMVEKTYQKVLAAEQVITKKITADEADILYAKITDLDVTNARITNLSADVALFKSATTETLEAQKASIDDLTAIAITTENLSAKVGAFGYITADEASLKYATISSINAVNAEITSIKADYVKVGELESKVATFGYAKVADLDATTAKVDNLEAKAITVDNLDAAVSTHDYIKVAYADANYANIQRLLATEASMNNLFAEQAEFNEATVIELEAHAAGITNLDAKHAEFVQTTTERLNATDATITDLNTKVAEIDNAYITEAEVDILVAGKGYLTELEAATLYAKKADFDTLTAKAITADNLSAKVADLGYAKVEELNAVNASIQDIQSTYVKTSALEASYAKIDYVESTYATVETLRGVQGGFEEFTALQLKTNDAYVVRMDAHDADIHTLETTVATIESAYMDEAEVNTLVVNKGYLTEAQVDTLIVNKGYIVEAEVETLITKKGYFTEAQVENLVVGKGYITSLETESLLSGYVKTTELEAERAEIDKVFADYAKVTDLSATNANVSNLTSDVAQFKTATTETLNAQSASIESLTAKDADLEDLIAEKATIANLNAANANISSLQTKVATIEGAYISTARVNSLLADYTKTTDLEATYATIANLNAVTARISTIESDYVKSVDLEADYITASKISTTYATISNLNSATARIGTLETTTVKAEELEAEVATFGYLKSSSLSAEVAKLGYATVTSLEAVDAKFNNLSSTYATLDLANVKAGSITTAMIGSGVVGTAQIADGSITDAKIVALTANKITAGTLSVERLEIRGSTSSIVYALNNITGALQSQNVDTLNGEILTERTITADKIVANAITANEIAARTITANKIVAGAITATEIASSTITADKLSVSTLSAITANLGTVTAGILQSENYQESNYSVDAEGNVTGSVLSGLKIDLNNKAYYTPQITIKDNFVSIKGFVTIGERNPEGSVGGYSLAVGDYNNASGALSFASGFAHTSSGTCSVAIGRSNTSSGAYSFALGWGCTASGNQASAGGYFSKATARDAFAYGYSCEANAPCNIAIGCGTIASGHEGQFVAGAYNVISTTDLFVVGNGSSSARSNAHTLDWSGNAWYAGNVKAAGTIYENGKTLASQYAALSHNHDSAYAAKSHNHDSVYAALSHSHNYAGSSSAGGPATSALTCTGNSATATKATQDSEGNVIVNTYLPKTTYEYNKELAMGSSGAICIGKFSMYDSNITVRISSTTSTTYSGTLVIATQNYGTTSGGSFTANVYGDVSNTIAPNIYIYNVGTSGVVEVYFKPSAYSKNLVHVQCMALRATPTDVLTSITSVPTTATTKPTNLLKSALDGKAASSHGNHVPTEETANNARFLRNDNTWATVTPVNIGAATSGHNHDSVYALKSHTHDYAASNHTHSEYALAGHSHTLDYRLQAAQSTATGSDANSATATGFHYINGTTNRPPFSQSSNNDYRILTTAYSASWLQQIATDFRCDDIFYRRNQNGAWQGWRRLAFADECAKKENGVYYIAGTGSTAGTWIGSHDEITEYYDGLTILYKVGIAGVSDGTTLNINSLGAIAVMRNASSAVTTHYGVNSVVLLTYTTDSGTGYWKIADYDANSYAYVRQYYTTAANNYPLLSKYDAGITTTSNYVTKYTRYSNKFYINPSTGVLTAPTFSGALDGNAATATKATQDGEGNVISSTYSKTGHTHSYLPLAGGTLTGELLISTGTTQSATKGIKWSAINSKNPYIGYATDQTDGTFVVGSLLGTNYASGLAIGGGSGNLLWKGARVATATDLAGYSPTSHTHNYAGSSSAGGSATSAVKLDTATAGSATQPVYFTGGKPTACTYTLGKSVPSNAVFTDTVYTHPSYTARTGVPTANATLTFGGTFTVSQPVSDATGHITAINSRTYTMPSDRLFTTLVPTGTAIPANADLNTTTYLKVGRYYCSANATVKTLVNCPLTQWTDSDGDGTYEPSNGIAFMMEVYSPLSTTIDNETTAKYVYRLRKITHYNTGVQFVQYVGSGATAGTFTYSQWRLVPNFGVTQGNSTTATNWGLGSATKPIYVNSSGNFAACSTYAGGTAVTLNGSSKAASTASFYAPTGAGTSGYVLTSTGGAPSWTAQSSLAVGSATKATQDGNGNVISSTYSTTAHTHATIYQSDGIGYVSLFVDSSNRYWWRHGHGTTYEYYFGSSNHRWTTIYSINALNTSSDLRLKTDISKDMDKYIRMLDLIEPITFVRTNTDEKRHPGYGAQWVEDAMCKVGLTEKDFAGLAKEIDPETGELNYGLAYEEFVPIIHAKVNKVEREHLARISALEARLDQKDLQIAQLYDQLAKQQKLIDKLMAA